MFCIANQVKIKTAVDIRKTIEQQNEERKIKHIIEDLKKEYVEKDQHLFGKTGYCCILNQQNPESTREE